MPPCPHFDLKIVQRSKRQSAVAAAAYQSGERLFSEYDQKQKYYSHKSEIVHTEIMLPPHAPPEYADRNTLWNAAEAIEKQWNSQLARRLVLAIPRDIPPAQQADLIQDYCREFFVSKGMIAGEVAEYKERLSAVQEDVKILRDVRHWLNQVLPSEQYRQTAEPGKKPSIQQAVKGRAQRIREEQAEKRQQPRTEKKQDMEL